MFGQSQVQKSESSHASGNSLTSRFHVCKVNIAEIKDIEKQQGCEVSQKNLNAEDALQTLSFEIGDRKVVAVSRRWYDRVGYSQKRWATTITFDDNTTMDILSTQEISASIECTLKTAPYSKAQRAQDIEQCFADWGITV
jgi:hypothetical protein